MRQVTHALLTRPPLASGASSLRPFDLHVLSTPPAFILSQDQTLCKSLFPLKTTVWLSLVFTVWFIEPFLIMNVKNFRESYVFHCLVIKVPVLRQLVYFITSFRTCQLLFLIFFNFFRFSQIFQMSCRFVDSLITLSCFQLFVNIFFIFSWNKCCFLSFYVFRINLFPTAHLVYHNH